MSSPFLVDGSGSAVYLSLVALGLELRADGDRLKVRGVNQLCCEAHREQICEILRGRKPDLVQILTSDSDPDVLAVLEEAEYAD